MSIVASDIEYRYSGGSTNVDPNAALGGVMSTQAGGTIDNAVKNDLFDDVSPAEATAGDIEYRGFYVKNNHGSLTLQDARIYHSADDAHAGDVVDMAIADEAMNATIETIANEGTAPVGPTFSHPTTYAGGIQLNGATGLTAGSNRGVWIRRTISAAASSASVTGNQLRVEGQTA